MRKGYWKTANGTYMRMEDMETSHIINTLGLLCRNLVAMEQVKGTTIAQRHTRQKIKELEKELKMRYL